MNTESPQVSIVLPTYKRAHVLPHAIRSVLAQTYASWELIVVDDNSPDDTAQVVASFDDPRIRYVKNETNLKLPRTLNRGFSLARGRYLTWTSDDNLYGTMALEKMVAVLQTGDCDFVYADYHLFVNSGPDGQPLATHHCRLPSQVQLEKSNHIGACFMYTRKVYETVGEYDPELFLVEDYDYFIRIAQRFRCGHIAEPLYYFRRDEDTLYCSRFAEVKVSDLLVRYRHGLLSEDDAVEILVALLLQNKAELRNPLLRWTYRAVRNTSYRLTVLQQQVASHYLRWRLRSSVQVLLRNYQMQQASYGATRDAIRALVAARGAIAYTPPPVK